MALNRRHFLKSSLAAAVAGLLHPAPLDAGDPFKRLAASAESVIFIWLPGGIAQSDTWDPKPHTPFQPGMRGDQVLSTCESIPTAVDGLRFGKGLERMASVMDRGTVLRSIANRARFGAAHIRAQAYMFTGYIPPIGVKAPSMGAIVSRTLGRRHPHIPAYIYIGRDLEANDEDKRFINEYIGPGFYGADYAPFMIPNPEKGLSSLTAAAGMSRSRFNRRQELYRSLTAASPKPVAEAADSAHFTKLMEDACAMMDSPVKQAFDFTSGETPETLEAYSPEIPYRRIGDKSYYHGKRFARGLLLARRLVEAGARFVQVEYQYGAFKGFDMHENGQPRMVEMKQQIDRPIARLISDLDERGLLDSTLVVLATEFGRTIASAPSAGTEPEGFAERHTGANLIIRNRSMYGLHGHFSSANNLLFWGGGFRKGHVHGASADEHPMVPVSKPVRLEDVHATIYRALGIPPDHAHITEGRPFYVTNNGEGSPIRELLT